MKPSNLLTKIFLDSADPSQTQEALKKIGFLDGQTTNPSLITKNPDIQKYIQSGKRFTLLDLTNAYKEVAQAISAQIPKGFVSVQVFADNRTSHQDMVTQAYSMNAWIPNAHIKLPTTQAGLTAAEVLVKDGIKLNMTLGFDQQQAAAVYAATQGYQKGDVFYSSFVGRLFDAGINGIANLKNVLQMYEKSDKHVEVLACSFRSYQQFLSALAAKTDVISASFDHLIEWKKNNFEIPDFQNLIHAIKSKKPQNSQNSQNSQNLSNNSTDSAAIVNLINPPYLDIDLEDKVWQMFEINNQLTRKGLEKFSADLNKAVQ